MAITACRGTVDILPADTPRWRHVEDTAHRLAQLYGYKELRTPAFEVTELFTNSLGEDSDITEKELYTFRDRSGRSLTLRPEFTVPVVRAYLEHNLGSQLQLKTYYVGEMWRYERPQSGRMREAHQFGLEAFGSSSPSIEAEIVDLGMTYLQALGLKDLRLEVNSVGCKKCRPTYQQVLREFFLGKDDVLCQDCERRKERNAMRVLDCRKEGCLSVTNTVPTIFQSLCTDCRAQFFSLKEHLSQMGYVVNGNPRIVHTMGYYTRNVWQVVSPHLGAFNPLCGGGRYDDLVTQLGNSGVPAVGMAVALERTLAALEKEGVTPPDEPHLDVFLVGSGDEAERIMTQTMHALRKRGYRVERDYQGRGLKNQLKSADKVSPHYTVVVGDEETRVSQVSIHDNMRGAQENASVARLVDMLDYKLRRDVRERGRDKGRDGDHARESTRGRDHGRDRDRGRDRDEREGRRDDAAERSPRGDRFGRERTDRNAGDDSASRFNEWATTYSEAARSSVHRPLRRIPLSESALTSAYTAEPARFAWASAQKGLAQAPANDVGRWPANPLPLAAAIPISLVSAPARDSLTEPDAKNGNWLVEGHEKPALDVTATFAVRELTAFDTPLAVRGEEALDDEDDVDDVDDDADNLAGVAPGAGGDEGERRRRGGRRGGRRHGRRRARKS